MSYPFDEALRRRIQANVSGFPDRRVAGGDLVHAAVAITVMEHEAEAVFLLTRRTRALSAHSGQFALPGGRVEPGESAVQASLRELHEEMGVELGEEAVIGLLDDYPTRSGYRITPVIVWGGGDVIVRPDPGEVAAVHYVPLGQLAHPDAPEFVSIEESDRPVIRLRIADARVHAPTAAVLYQFREVAIFGRDTRVEHLEQPVWAWR